jgi:hypothetical protein
MHERGQGPRTDRCNRGFATSHKSRGANAAHQLNSPARAKLISYSSILSPKNTLRTTLRTSQTLPQLALRAQNRPTRRYSKPAADQTNTRHRQGLIKTSYNTLNQEEAL